MSNNQGQHEQTQRVDGAGSQCSFTYSLQSKPRNNEHALVDGESIVQDIMKSSRCIEAKVEDWTYSVCFGDGGHVEQVSGKARNTLGKWNGKTFTGGSECKGKPRQVDFEFVCMADHDAQDLWIESVLENPTCQYVFQIGTSRVCGDPSFPVIMTGETTDEDWVVETRQVSTGIICRAYAHFGGGNLALSSAALTLRLPDGQWSCESLTRPSTNYETNYSHDTAVLSVTPNGSGIAYLDLICTGGISMNT